MMSETTLTARLLEAAKLHVPLDGWSETTLRMAADDAGLDRGLIPAICPRGPVDLALAYHDEGDRAMLDRLRETDLTAMRFRDRVAYAVRLRLEVVEDRELVHRGTTLFALPQHAADGARAIWRTCDHIWTALGDASDDLNWYTKRATLAGVYASTVLYWLGDESENAARTWEFLDRRIDDVMRIETLKGRARENRLVSGLMAGPLKVLSRVKAPRGHQQTGMPGRWRGSH
jgi:ubiquinone biosynthesis protein COQ9